MPTKVISSISRVEYKKPSQSCYRNISPPLTSAASSSSSPSPHLPIYPSLYHLLSSPRPPPPRLDPNRCLRSSGERTTPHSQAPDSSPAPSPRFRLQVPPRSPPVCSLFVANGLLAFLVPFSCLFESGRALRVARAGGFGSHLVWLIAPSSVRTLLVSSDVYFSHPRAF
jgi:hypothetical protein